MVLESQSHLGFQATKNSDSKVRFLTVYFFLVFIDLGLDQEVFHSFSLNKDWIFMWVLCVCYMGAFVFIGLELDTEPAVKFLAAALSLAITGSVQ